MNNKKSPSKFVKNLLSKFNLSVTDAAELLKSPRPNLSMIINGNMEISPIMALRLQKVFGIEPRELLIMQLDQQIALAKKEFKEKGIRLKRLKVSKYTYLVYNYT